MVMVVLCLAIGWLLSNILLYELSFLLVWLLITFLGIVIDVLRIRRKQDIQNSVGFWLMLGALGPIYLQVLGMF